MRHPDSINKNKQKFFLIMKGSSIILKDSNKQQASGSVVKNFAKKTRNGGKCFTKTGDTTLQDLQETESKIDLKKEEQKPVPHKLPMEIYVPALIFPSFMTVRGALY